ncbi:MAG: amidase [Chloroflexi bacterium]|nr:MAG: amidase [Chloroflexota bacterium]TMG31946.1 MAG: amidase [Chloroflexota bacterium]
MIEASARWLSATDAMQRVRAGDLKPQEVVDAHLDAIDRFDSRIHAYIHVDRNARTTSGVTLAVKDSQPVAGMPYTYGTPSWRDRIAEVDAVPVARARSSGMAILGKTNLPELAASIGTTNTMFPPTQNPWREGITPGGSSGGSGAAVAAGMASVALGGDTGGSIRIPASCCGVVGLRPTPDRIPSEEVDATVLQSRGPMTRTVADARLLFSVMTATRPTGVSSKRRLLIGTAFAGADPACQDACRRAAKALENAGHEIQEIKWDPEPVTEGYAVVRRASMASFPADLSTFGPGIRKLAEEGRSLTAMDYFHAFELATHAANRAVAVPLQTRYDFLLTPTLGLPPMQIEKVPPFLGEEWARHVQFVLPVTFARSPAISIPAGLHEGLPIGVQLVGQFGQEYDLLDFAEQLEQMPGFGFQRPPEMEVTG